MRDPYVYVVFWAPIVMLCIGVSESFQEGLAMVPKRSAEVLQIERRKSEGVVIGAWLTPIQLSIAICGLISPNKAAQEELRNPGGQPEGYNPEASRLETQTQMPPEFSNGIRAVVKTPYLQPSSPLRRTRSNPHVGMNWQIDAC